MTELSAHKNNAYSACTQLLGPISQSFMGTLCEFEIERYFSHELLLIHAKDLASLMTVHVQRNLTFIIDGLY